MPLLTIDLREGFSHDAVVVRVDGHELFRSGDLSTRNQIGLARSLSVEAAGTVAVEISLPGRNLAETVRIEVAAQRHLGISIGRDGRIVAEISEVPFRYL